MTHKKVLSELLTYMNKVMASTESYLPSEFLNMVGTAEEWSAKDNIYHALVWATRRLDMLETVERDETWVETDYGDFYDANQEIYEEYKDRSWDEVKKMTSSTYQRGQAYLDRINEEILLDKIEGDERPFWRILADNFVTHPMLHIWDLLQKSGRGDKVVEIFGEKLAKMLRKLDNSNNWQGLIDYNLACVYSLSGELKKSVETLAEALKKNPLLTDWSKEDPDLDALRELPGYLELYQDLNKVE